MLGSSVFLPFTQSAIRWQGHAQGGSSHQGQTSPNHPHSQAQKPVSLVILAPVLLTVKVNHHTCCYLGNPDALSGKLSFKEYCVSTQLRKAVSKKTSACANKCVGSETQSQVGGRQAWTVQAHLRDSHVSPRPL